MITKENIEERIAILRQEEAMLKTVHERAVTEYRSISEQYQQRFTGNQNRFQQITGAIAQLTSLLNGSEKPKGEPNEPTNSSN